MVEGGQIKREVFAKVVCGGAKASEIEFVWGGAGGGVKVTKHHVCLGGSKGGVQAAKFHFCLGGS